VAELNSDPAAPVEARRVEAQPLGGRPARFSGQQEEADAGDGNGLALTGTFVFRCDNEAELVRRSVAFACEQKLS